MKKKVLAMLLALVMCLAMLPAAAFATGVDLPDWYFLFAIFKNVDADAQDSNGNVVHTKYTMTQEEINFVTEDARDFEKYMNSVGVMRAHVDVVEIDTTVTELENRSNGSCLSTKEAAPLLKEALVDVDRYDHITCITSLNISTDYLGLGGSSYENGTGHACINLINRDNCLNVLRKTERAFPPSVYVHEFLHFVENTNPKWGSEFCLHDIRSNHYLPNTDNAKECYMDIILNRARGTAGTGVHPVVWQYPPRVLRTMTELTVPSGVTSIGDWAFSGYMGLTSVTIDNGVTSIGVCAFDDCTGLISVTIPDSVTSIGDWAFSGCMGLTSVTIGNGVTSIGICAFDECTGLTSVTIPDSVTSIGDWAFSGCMGLTGVTIGNGVTSIGVCAFSNCEDLKDVYYGGTEAQWKAITIGDYNETLTNAAIHYNSPMPDQPVKGVAHASSQTVLLDGKPVKFQMYALKDANGYDTNYIKLRDMAYALMGTQAQFSVDFNPQDLTITAASGGVFKPNGDEMTDTFGGADKDYTKTVLNIQLDGKPVELEAITLKDDAGGGYNYCKVADLGKVFNFNVYWKGGTGICVETDKPYTGKS